MEVPLLASPFMRPFCIFLCFVLFGCNILLALCCYRILLISSVASAATTATMTTATAASSVISAATTTVSTMSMIIIPSFSSVSHITLTTHEIGVQISLGQNFTFTDPYLDTDLSIYGKSEYIGIVNIHTECMQRHTSLFDLFCTSDFRTTQTAG